MLLQQQKNTIKIANLYLLKAILISLANPIKIRNMKKVLEI